jgi:hypothetical protein
MLFPYKTLYIPAPEIKSKSAFSTGLSDFNGDQLARDVQAALLEMASEGYTLHTTTAVHTSRMYMGSTAYSLTDGILLIFEKKNTE